MPSRGVGRSRVNRDRQLKVPKSATADLGLGSTNADRDYGFRVASMRSARTTGGVAAGFAANRAIEGARIRGDQG